MVIPDLSQADIALIGFGGSTPVPVRVIFWGREGRGGAGILFLFILLMLSDVLHREDAVGILLLSIGSDRRRRRRRQ